MLELHIIILDAAFRIVITHNSHNLVSNTLCRGKPKSVFESVVVTVVITFYNLVRKYDSNKVHQDFANNILQEHCFFYCNVVGNNRKISFIITVL